MFKSFAGVEPTIDAKAKEYMRQQFVDSGLSAEEATTMADAVTAVTDNGLATMLNSMTIQVDTLGVDSLLLMVATGKVLMGLATTMMETGEEIARRSSGKQCDCLKCQLEVMLGRELNDEEHKEMNTIREIALNGNPAEAIAKAKEYFKGKVVN